MRKKQKESESEHIREEDKDLMNILEKKTVERRQETMEARQSRVNDIRTYRTLKRVIVKGDQ